jgi:hypothetical protein
MAKGKRKRGKKGKKGGGAVGANLTGDFWVHLLRETIGNFAGQLMADNTPKCASSTDAKGDEQECDVAADVLRVLSESGPRSIADLLAETNAGLTPLLHALRTARELRLVEIVGEDDLVQLTPTGGRTASVLRRAQIEHDGMKQLAS